jgi:opacity protein-like surface antigen
MLTKWNYYTNYLAAFITILGLQPFNCNASSSETAHINPNGQAVDSKNYSQNSYRKPGTSFKAIQHYNAPKNYREVKVCPEHYNDMFYGRVSANCNLFELDALSSAGAELTSPLVSIPIPAGTFQTEGLSSLCPRTEIALGYIWCNLRAEMEFLINSKINTSINATFNPIQFPLIGPLPPTPLHGPISAQLENKTYLANLYYDFMFSERIRPFLTCGLGASVNKLTLSSTQTILDNTFTISTQSKQRVDLAYAAGLGLRVRIFPYCFLTASYRYIGLGLVETETNPISFATPLGGVNIPGFKFEGNLNQQAVSIGIMYLI